MATALSVRTPLLESSRLGSLSRPGTRLSSLELAALSGLGVVAALATAWLHPRLQVPGHAILRGVLPMALGLSLVPRSGSGFVMSIGTLITALMLNVIGVGSIPTAALVGLVALGPLLDAAMAHVDRGWPIYGRLMAAGLAANLFAYAARFSAAWLALDPSGGRHFRSFGPLAFVSFALCGALAGLLSGVLWFRAARVAGSHTFHETS